MHTTRHNPAVFFSWRTMLFVLASWLLIITPTEVLGQGCAMCQTVMPRGDDPLARGMFWSVLLLMTMPFVIGSSIGGWIFYRYRKASRAQRATAAVLPLNLSTTLKEGQP